MPYSDSVAFTVPTSTLTTLTSNSYQYNFKATLPSLPSLAFGTVPNYLGIWNANFVSSMANPFDEFAIAPKSVSASSVDFEFKYKANVWRSVKIGFLVCTLPDLKMGSSFLSTYVSMQMWDLCVHPTLSNSYKCRISPTIKNQLLEFSSTDSASMRDRRESKSKSRHDRSSRMGFMLPLPVDLKLISKVSCSHIWCSVLPP